MVLAAVGGLLLGGVTLVLQGLLPGSWNQLANSGAVWSAGAFAAGGCLSVTARRAAIVGLATLLGADVGYYASTTVFLHQDLSAAALRGPVIWAVVALVAGPLFGLAGCWYGGDRPRRRLAAICLLSAVFVAEGLYLLVALHYRGAAAIMIAVGLAAALLLARSARERLRALLVLVPVGLLGVAAYLLLGQLVSAAFLA